MEFSAIIQARRGSTRLPDKIMKKIVGKPLLLHVLERVKHAKLISGVYVATTEEPKDEILGEITKSVGVETYYGSIQDVLDRYYKAAKKFRIKHIVRITSDCPLIDSVIIDEAVKKFSGGNYDYLSNTINPTYPDGLDTEVFTFNALERAWKEVKIMSDREHVTPYIWKNPKLFKLGELTNTEDLSYLRWTVDTKEDLVFVRKVYRHLYPANPCFRYKDILELLKQYPSLQAINQGIERNEGYKKSLKEDSHTIL